MPKRHRNIQNSKLIVLITQSFELKGLRQEHVAILTKNLSINFQLGVRLTFQRKKKHKIYMTHAKKFSE